jgi:hypothetical protein
LIKANFNKVKEHHTEDYKDLDNEKVIDGGSMEKIKIQQPINDSSDGISSVEEVEDNMIIHAYKSSWFGNFIGFIFCLQTIGQVGYMILITEDYYKNYSLFRGSWLVQSSTFIGMWYILFFWFAGLTIFRHRIMNFFRIRCSYGQGQYVQVERKLVQSIYITGIKNFVD